MSCSCSIVGSFPCKNKNRKKKDNRWSSQYLQLTVSNRIETMFQSMKCTPPVSSIAWLPAQGQEAALSSL